MNRALILALFLTGCPAESTYTSEVYTPAAAGSAAPETYVMWDCFCSTSYGTLTSAGSTDICEQTEAKAWRKAVDRENPEAAVYCDCKRIGTVCVPEVTQ